MADKPAEINDDNFINNLYINQIGHGTGRSTIKVVHLADLHLDFKYKQGSLAVCDKILCCRENSGDFPKDPKKMAGAFGSYECDSPV